MIFLNAWILFAFIPLYFIYKRHTKSNIAKEIKVLYVSLVFMLLAAARPAIDNSYINQTFNSQDFIIALDASYSMQADDLKPTRYIMAKNAIKKLLKLRPRDRFTLFIFTSNTLLISPPTTDTSISIMALDAINPQYILTKSTNIANLFETVAKISMKEKKLIIFTDGGDEHNIAQLSRIAKKNNIIPYIVATATQKGAALKKENHYLKDIHSNLVISKINPILKDLAVTTDGKYYQLTSLNTINKLNEDLTDKVTTKKQIKVKSYKELFYIPLGIALLLFFLSITKFGAIIFILPLLFILPQKADASLLDFYHIKQAKKLYKSSHYKEASKEYQAITPSIASYYNIATALYKEGNYKAALSFYSKIQTTNPKIKQKILYNIGNCAIQLKKYDRAKKFYIQALAFGEDKDTLYNLTLLKRLHLKTQIDTSDMLPKKQNQSKKTNKKSEQKEKKDTKNAKSNSKSNRSSQQSTNGSGGEKKKQTVSISKKKVTPDNYKMSYKAYEKINKGYSDEKEPW